MKSIQEIIHIIEINKHDIVLRVRSVVRDPIVYMNKKGAAETIYFSECKDKNTEILVIAEKIMTIFDEKWRDINSSEEEQIQQIHKKVLDIQNIVIPKIKYIVAYYQDCSEKKHYFSSTETGNNALKKMCQAVNRVDNVCAGLLRIDQIEDTHNSSTSTCNLLELIQESFDLIDADVNYIDEYIAYKLMVETNRETLHDHVLNNITNNINEHAFNTSTFKYKHTWEKKVRVSITVNEKKYIIKVQNNGEPFRGNVENIFDYGYCHGEQMHNGIGLNSARKHLRELGGELTILTDSLSDYKVTYIINIPKS